MNRDAGEGCFANMLICIHCAVVTLFKKVCLRCECIEETDVWGNALQFLDKSTQTGPAWQNPGRDMESIKRHIRGKGHR